MSLFNFQDSRPFLRDYITKLPSKGRGEVSRIAGTLGVSTTLVSQVLAGDKSFTLEQAQRLTMYLGLSGLEQDYFILLVQLERAGTADLKKYWRGKLDELKERAQKIANRVRPDKVLSEEERAVFYSTPLFSAIRLYTTVGDKGKTLDEIAERFELTRARAAELLKFLAEAGLCKVSDGHYSMGVQSTHLEQGSPHLLKHHANWRVRAIHQSERLREDELMYTAPVSLSREDFGKLREGMVGFIKEFLKTVHASPAEEIACLNLDFFWIDR